ncbi:MAG: hypothetical protein PWP16_474 [Eubacteriaceae bacterium]|jgi:hypothetical protein|nr:hypothetical protein [Eubacteriaceae bacterium]MDK2904371.1 hypothetical protein [Eubacteriaceae bacterium]MDK2935009.1 hypothetical protein [Eubacteriaceae bacterium]MDK2961692.1 hypothetical protein [Eubacteriaceae bacterium]MDN5307111.1 hypothetical protein [Eubacteriaceae bacterium]
MDENKERSIEELFEELKDELVFLPEIDAVRAGYLFGFKYTLIQ